MTDTMQSLNLLSLIDRWKAHCTSQKTDLRAKLIDACSEHQGWEESAIAIVDEAIMPVLAAFPANGSRIARTIEQFENIAMVADIIRNTLICGDDADNAVAIMTNGSGHLALARAFGEATGIADGVIEALKVEASRLKRESGWVATMDKSAPVRHHLLLWSSLKPEQGIQYCYYDISDAEWYWFNDYGQAIEFVSPTHWQLPKIPTNEIEALNPLPPA